MEMSWSIEKNFVRGDIIVRDPDGVSVNHYDISTHVVEIEKESHICIRSLVDSRTVFFANINNVIFFTS